MLLLLLALQAHADVPLPAGARRSGEYAWRVKGAPDDVMAGIARSAMRVPSVPTGMWMHPGPDTTDVFWVDRGDRPQHLSVTPGRRRSELVQDRSLAPGRLLAWSPRTDHLRLGCITETGAELVVEQVPLGVDWSLISARRSEDELVLVVDTRQTCGPDRPPIWVPDGAVHVSSTPSAAGCTQTIRWTGDRTGTITPTGAADAVPCRTPPEPVGEIDGRIDAYTVTSELERHAHHLRACMGGDPDGLFVALDIAGSGEIEHIEIIGEVGGRERACLTGIVSRLELPPLPGGAPAHVSGVPLP